MPSNKLQKRIPRKSKSKIGAKKLRVALVADWLVTVGGSEKVLLELHKLYPKAPIYTTIYNPDTLPEFKDARVITSFLQNMPGAARRHQLYVPLMPLAIGRFDLGDYDLVISSSNTIGHGVKVGPEAVHICYCHTPVRWAYAPEVDNLNDRLPLGPLARVIESYFKWWSKRKARGVTQFIANSQFVRARIKKAFGRDAVVIHPPVEVGKIPLQVDKDDYYLMAGRLVGYKKPEVVVEAFNQLGLPLHIVGTGPMLKDLKSMAGPKIKFTGFLHATELSREYRCAKALVFAALEDFGMVPVEAMAAGTPVIGYGAGGLLETVTDGLNGILFPKQRAVSVIRAVKRFRQTQFDPEQIRQHAKQFDAKVFRRKIKALIRRVYKANNSNKK